VSSKKQENDLKHQVSFIKEKYPDYEVLTDIGSGINPNRKNFKTLLDRILDGTVKEVVVAHKDRLSRFSFDIIQLICRKFGTKLIVIDDKENKEPAEELTEDLMSVITVFSARYYGSRKY
jgi:predicted site-specific integrase-resolvase